MGWLFMYSMGRKKDMIAHRTENWTVEPSPENGNAKVETVCLKHCYRGNNFKGVLWAVWERTILKPDGKEVKRYITCDLLEYSKRDECWGYKDMDESVHPYYYSCPPGYLNMVPEVACQEWRNGVLATHEKMVEKRAERKALAR